jgi:hypothetical protein
MNESRDNFARTVREIVSGLSERLREWLSPAGLLAGLRTLLWLGPLTILIWYYAERSISTKQTMQITVAMRSPQADRVVSLQEPADGQLTIELEGPRADVDALTRGVGHVELTVQSAETIGQQVPPAAALLNDAEPFRSSRARVASANPVQLRIYVDEYAEQAVKVTVPESVRNLNAAAFDPPTVTIRAPARELSAAEAAGTLRVEADIANLPQLREPGRKDPVGVRVRTTLGPRATVQPATVTASLEVRSEDVAFTIPSMPVWASLPPTFADQYRVAVQPDTLFNVKVTGPEEAVRQLRENKFPARARLDFTPEEIDAARGGAPALRRKAPAFILPEGVRVEPAEVDRLQIEWTVTRRATG